MKKGPFTVSLTQIILGLSGPPSSGAAQLLQSAALLLTKLLNFA